MSAEIIAIVDDADRLVDAVPRAQMRALGLTYRVTYILVFNAAGQLLVQRRTADKDMYPGYLDLAAGGVVLADESYEQSAARELAEELGVTATLEPHFDLWFDDSGAQPPNRNWGRVFTCLHEGPFRLQPEEVAAAEFMDVQEALQLDESTVTPDTRHVLLAYLLPGGVGEPNP